MKNIFKILLSFICIILIAKNNAKFYAQNTSYRYELPTLNSYVIYTPIDQCINENVDIEKEIILNIIIDTLLKMKIESYIYDKSIYIISSNERFCINISPRKGFNGDLIIIFLDKKTYCITKFQRSRG